MNRVSLEPKSSASASAVDHSIGAATRALLALQQPDGHWVFELEADATIPAEYVLLRHYLAEPVAGDQRPAGLPSRCQRFAQDGAGEARAPLLRLDVERRQPERPRQELVERTRAFHGFADGFFFGGVEQTRK